MKKITVYLLLFSVFLWIPFGWASSTDYPLDKVSINLDDKASLQRGARLFVNYCLSCHSAKYIRYNRIARDLDLTEEQVSENLMFTTDKIHDTMTIAMRPKDAENWFGGVSPPDLSLVARSRGPAWIHTYLRTFYLDPEIQATGVNNLVFKDTAMPHVLWPLQGWQKLADKQGKASQGEEADAHGEEKKLELVIAGAMTPTEYEQALDDLVNFMAYVGEPARIDRKKIGPWALLFLVVFCGVTYLLKREYWKDIH
jgi:ubiquinol-cytochrome c reductase cytochrome c1 subunit